MTGLEERPRDGSGNACGELAAETWAENAESGCFPKRVDEVLLEKTFLGKAGSGFGSGESAVDGGVEAAEWGKDVGAPNREGFVMAPKAF